ncbi:uncharacterized protein LACBIDRAFT_326543 [Laccaria bicolor S238N-H82]|uniref:Predicted protein n=1 Tax=Laccaria bicolor (strain S238N-H82 / ATCC MYA-4686) TaxID=486041 RepID=B0D8Y6_LACBS|nr:uncharacterized protein LACBIDRAFT_326543 [Laccaria bicolor S238N-H82]EDR09156.1 predicted protein [Laccaria bicolor S238N-H82]|eukprot:XP_001880469.1 predicted protein [Laccaria bicolor S238N-H82]
MKARFKRDYRRRRRVIVVTSAYIHSSTIGPLYNGQRHVETGPEVAIDVADFPVKEEMLEEKLKEMEAERDEMKVAQREMEGLIKKQQEETAKTTSHLQDSNEHLCKQNKALQMKASRALTAKSKSAEVVDALALTSRRRLKEDGVVTDDARILVRNLIECNIPVKHVGKAIDVVAQHFGIEVPDKISKRTVGSVVLEGGIAAEMQIVDEANHSQNITLSGDGTTLRNVNYESKHFNYRTTLYNATGASSTELGSQNDHRDPPDSECVTRFLGLTSSKDHTAETQIMGWKETNSTFNETYSDSPRGKINPVNPRAIPAKFTGNGTDHAPDQKKVARGLRQWKVESERIVRGEREANTWTVEVLLKVVVEENQKKVSAVGGLDTFDALSPQEQDVQNKAMYERVCSHVGEKSFNAMSAAQQHAANLFIWVGCCMHKELNAIKIGDTSMGAFWKEENLTPPMKLMNKDNARAAGSGSATAKENAEAVSQGGGTKLTSLAGAIFNHKDDKKGQGDTFRMFFEQEIGSETFVNPLSAYPGIDLLFPELAVLSLYSQAISHPYLRQVRGPGKQFTNVLDLGPLHTRVKEHCHTIISNPDLLLSPGATSATGALDGKVWERPEAVYTVHAMMDTLPHLRGTLVAFFTGALEGWKCFTTEFEPGGAIDLASPEECERAWIKTTNDDNEGALGVLRVGSRRAPNMSNHQRNAREMHKKNQTKYLKYLRRKAHERDSSQLEKTWRLRQAKADRDMVEAKREKDSARSAAKAKVNAELDKVTVRLDVSAVEASPGSNATLDLELAWFRRIDKEVPVKSKLGNKNLKKEALLKAIERHLVRMSRAQNQQELEAQLDLSSEWESYIPEENTSNIDSDADMELGY